MSQIFYLQSIIHRFLKFRLHWESCVFLGFVKSGNPKAKLTRNKHIRNPEVCEDINPIDKETAN